METDNEMMNGTLKDLSISSGRAIKAMTTPVSNRFLFNGPQLSQGLRQTLDPGWLQYVVNDL